MKNEDITKTIKSKYDLLNLIERQEDLLNRLGSNIESIGSIKKLEKENKELKERIEKYEKELKKFRSMKFYKISKKYWSFRKKMKGAGKK